MAEDELRKDLLMLSELILKVAAKVPSPKVIDDVEIPYSFLCPLHKSIMIDPVLLSNGQTFEKSEIEYYLALHDTICPLTGQELTSKITTPNHLLRILIRDWCKKHNKSHLISYNHSTPLYITKEYFESLHLKLSSADQKEAVKDVRKETTNCPYFRRLYAKLSKPTRNLILPLLKSDKNPIIDAQVQEDLITTLMLISDDDKVKKEIAELPEGIPVLIQALQSNNIETQRCATSTIFQISSIDSNKKIVGDSGAMLKLATLLMRDMPKLLHEAVIKTLLRLFQINENKVKAVKQFAEAGIFQKFEDSECIETMLPIFASLSKIEEGISEIEKYVRDSLFRIMRDSSSAQVKEHGTMILFALLLKDGSKWKKIIIEEETACGTISKICKTGKLNAQWIAEAILDRMDRMQAGH